MNPTSELGQPALFRIVSGSDIPNDLSERERRLLVGALNFHALVAPSRVLEVHVYDGDAHQLPRTTDDTTFHGLATSYRNRLFSLEIESLVPAENRQPIAAEGPAQELRAGRTRHIRLTRDAVLSADPPRDVARGRLRRAARAVRTRWPLAYDTLRDIELLRHRKPLHAPIARLDYPSLFAPGGIHEDSEIVMAPSAPEGAPRAVIFGLHWFELGGAEHWALESIRLAREAGFLPIVMTSRDSHQPWIQRQELDGAVLVPFSEATTSSQTPGVEEVLRGIFANFDVRGVVVHHNQWMYDRVAWMRLSRPSIPIVDSTHIVEYRGGGYPVSSAIVDAYLTTHHVISPSLKDFLVDVQALPAEKVLMAPLAGLTAGESDMSFRRRQPGEPFTVAFVGRMARQKGPELFVKTVSRLRARGHRDIRFIMHGDGELAGWVDGMIAAGGLQDVIERRSSADPVAATLERSHLLVVSSHNEGLTLTTLEALTHGVPVVSTDVGAQRDVLPPRALVARRAHRAVRELTERVAWLAGDEAAREQLWLDERAAEKHLHEVTSASQWFAEEVSTW
ncbi:glycosyltransferase [Microbacterium sp. Sa4CUA7]|uniref:Glycosyltransferase n=1 Tax=Microbacterium pullorum TaxID=2762236 RepID=A0ABR8S172_9MICO|nr:glycosyltransferase [Microbacterium pullorum]MBD7957235.1 glycosyltransferase [Microbacterium pullorum]